MIVNMLHCFILIKPKIIKMCFFCSAKQIVKNLVKRPEGSKDIFNNAHIRLHLSVSLNLLKRWY